MSYETPRIDYPGQIGCSWESDVDDDGDEILSTQCGWEISFGPGKPVQEGFRFCPYCGEPINFIDPLEEDEE